MKDYQTLRKALTMHSLALNLPVAIIKSYLLLYFIRDTCLRAVGLVGPRASPVLFAQEGSQV